MRVYFDNAATTPMDKAVIQEMVNAMRLYGNPSSVHSHGRAAKAAIEQARKLIAKSINASPLEIYFTSGGTEADNIAIRGLIKANKLKYAITSPVEHHAVLHTLQDLEKQGAIEISYVKLQKNGDIDYAHLETLLKSNPGALISLMHGNNEIGNMTAIQQIGRLCKKYTAFFHSDTVQTIGHFPVDVDNLHIHALVGAAHKFHGPKGIGFLYLKGGSSTCPLQTGGGQERNTRAGTENVIGIVGMAKAFEIATSNLTAHTAQIKSIKARFIGALAAISDDLVFNGNCAALENSLYTILNVGFPKKLLGEMPLFNLDLKGVSASGGSACNSGSNEGSHVIKTLNHDSEKTNIRFSFSKYNTAEEVAFVAAQLKAIASSQKMEIY